MDNYVVLRSLGAGSFGSVFLARHLPSGDLVALKKVRIKRPSDGLPRVLLREIQALEKLSAEHGSARSRHVLKLREYFAQGAAVVLVMELMVADLQMVIKSMATAGRRMEPKAVKLIMWMCVCGVSERERRAHKHGERTKLLGPE
jgi:serine/threonine protein kinase